MAKGWRKKGMLLVHPHLRGRDVMVMPGAGTMIATVDFDRGSLKGNTLFRQKSKTFWEDRSREYEKRKNNNTPEVSNERVDRLLQNLENHCEEFLFNVGFDDQDVEWFLHSFDLLKEAGSSIHTKVWAVLVALYGYGLTQVYFQDFFANVEIDHSWEDVVLLLNDLEQREDFLLHFLNHPLQQDKDDLNSLVEIALREATKRWTYQDGKNIYPPLKEVS